MQISRRTLLSVVIFSFLSSCEVQAGSVGVSPAGFSLDPFSFKSIDQQEQEERGAIDVTEILDSKGSLVPHQTIMTENEWQECECDYALELLDRTQTKFGPWGLKHLLWPVKDRDEIQRRQDIVRTLVEHEELFEQLHESLCAIHEVEHELLAYWDELDGLSRSARRLYYNLPIKKLNKKLNTSKLALEYSILAELFNRASHFGLNLGMSGVFYEGLRSISVEGKDEPFSWKRGILNGLHEPVRQHTLSCNLFKDGIKKIPLTGLLTQATFGDKSAYLKNILQGYMGSFKALQPIAGGTSTVLSYALNAVALGVYDMSWTWKISEAAQRLTFLYKTVNKLQARMMHIARMFRALEDFRVCIHNTGVLQEQMLIGEFEVISTHNEQFSQDLRTLLELLEKSTFQREASAFYSRGNVLLAHKLLTKVKEELIPILQVVGELDAYLSIAKLYKEFCDNEQTPFCFAEFVETDEPYMQLEDLWAPLLCPTQAVTNSLAMGCGGAPNKIVLTGPNGGGKSTIMKAIAYAALLAQSWGIVPAYSAKISLFDGIRTSLNTQEDIRQGLSTFMAEKFRIDGIKKFLKEHQGKKTLILLDEPYSGTVESEAAYRVNILGHELAGMPDCALIMATHLKEPIRLVDETLGAFANYQVELLEQADGSFIRTFKLLPGAATWWFNDMRKRSRFVDQLIAEEEDKLDIN